MLGAFGAGLVSEIIEKRAAKRDAAHDAANDEMRQRLGRSAGIVPVVDGTRPARVRRRRFMPLHLHRPFVGFGTARATRA
jgi:hypothetical protein